MPLFEFLFNVLFFVTVIALIWFAFKAVIKIVIALIIIIILLACGRYLFGNEWLNKKEPVTAILQETLIS
jgi:hypothetical protein